MNSIAVGDSAEARLYPDFPRVAVGAFVFRDDRILLVRRAHPPAEGLWAIPGGIVALGETLQQAVEREILEETGVAVKAGEAVLTFEHIERDADGRVRFHYVIVDFLAEYLGGGVRPAGDAGDARWVAAGELSRLGVSRHTTEFLGKRFGFGPG